MYSTFYQVARRYLIVHLEVSVVTKVATKVLPDGVIESGLVCTWIEQVHKEVVEKLLNDDEFSNLPLSKTVFASRSGDVFVTVNLQGGRVWCVSYDGPANGSSGFCREEAFSGSFQSFRNALNWISQLLPENSQIKPDASGKIIEPELEVLDSLIEFSLVAINDCEPDMAYAFEEIVSLASSVLPPR